MENRLFRFKALTTKAVAFYDDYSLKTGVMMSLVFYYIRGTEIIPRKYFYFALRKFQFRNIIRL